MEHQAVQSRDIAIIGYEAAERLLEVAFRSGHVYRYYEVPAETHRGFLDAASHGLFFKEKIRDVFRHEKIR